MILTKYKDVIRQAAYELAVQIVGISVNYLTHAAGTPVLDIGVRATDKRHVDTCKEFLTTLRDALGDSQPFTLSVVPVSVADDCDVQIVRDKKWVYEQPHV